LIRRLVVLKLWQAGDTFDPARLMQKFTGGREFVEKERICEDCVRGFGFLAELTDDERTLARDKYQREQAAAERVRAALR
jgi:hypothetical protein